MAKIDKSETNQELSFAKLRSEIMDKIHETEVNTKEMQNYAKHNLDSMILKIGRMEEADRIKRWAVDKIRTSQDDMAKDYNHKIEIMEY